MPKNLLTIRSRINFGLILDYLCRRRLSKKRKSILTARGHNMAVFANENIGISINIFGTYELEELKVLFQYLEPISDQLHTGTALDVGANVGNHSLYFAKYFNEIHAFEPSPDIFYLLKFNTKSKKHIYPHMLGVGDKQGSFKLIENEMNMGGSYIHADGPGDKESIDVTVNRLDDLEIDKSNVVFIKIDVENFEQKVLEGAQAILESCKPIVVFEQQGSEFSDGSSASVNLLQNLGYKICWLEDKSSSKSSGTKFSAFIFEMILGRTVRIRSGKRIPERYHAMLIAVPPRFQDKLGLA